MISIDTLNAYCQRVIEAIEEIKASEVDEVARRLEAVRGMGGAVYVMGNGGSYANAQHLVLHLRDVGVRAFDLMSDNAWLTAYSNDVDYDLAASSLFEHLMKPNDVLFVISGSGTSRNIIEMIPFKPIGLLGSGGGEIGLHCRAAVILPQTEYGPIEDAHSVVVHMIFEALK